MHKIIKHDKYVEELCLELRDSYDKLHRNVPLRSRRKRLVAEIDILAEKEGYYDVYEVKCSYRKTKARMQLAKIKKIINRNEKKVRNVYFFCGESGLLEIIPQI